MPTRPAQALLFLLGFWLALVLLQPIGDHARTPRAGAVAGDPPGRALPAIASPPARIPSVPTGPGSSNDR